MCHSNLTYMYYHSLVVNQTFPSHLIDLGEIAPFSPAEFGPILGGPGT